MIVRVNEAREFFATEVNHILNKRKAQLHVKRDICQDEIDYLVNLLARYVEAQQFNQEITTTPLFDLAQIISRELPATNLQGLADFCLFYVGFFPLAFSRRKAVPRKNFICSGQTAYQLLSQRNSAKYEMYCSLASNFLLFANLISEIRLRGMAEKDIFKLFELWQETDNPYIADLLVRLGVSTVKIPSQQ